ncbi:NUDIX hydrolase [Devosia sediminis]|uniref:NUDIX hydrolase n=1 Tax=Devosia sediminis TaxID=2798801 RepID=A0A934IRG4_9HYPH|nr:NUDIX hydrolase [Devosia sediminis]MBJ3783831.1 NUDIX hydrolase [Devosia sediminis]
MTIDIVPITASDFRLAPGAWPMPAEIRAKVPGIWAEVVAKNPHVWDGRILGFTPPVLDGEGVFRSEAREDSYSAFLAWRALGFPDIGTVHIFGTTLIESADGALIFGVMGGKTINAGRVYPPGGALEPRDVRADGVVDAETCIATELHEETGLRMEDGRAGQLLAIVDGPRIAIARRLSFDLSAEALVARIHANLAAQDDPELSDVVACRKAADGEAAGDLAPYARVVLDAFAAGRLWV